MQHREADSRGQIIIVTALVVAVTFVGLAFVLNSGIYAENLSSRETTDTTGALAFTEEAGTTIEEAYHRTNTNDSETATEAQATFNETVDSWAELQKQRRATQGTGINLERTAHLGWRLEQSTDRSFAATDDPDATNWTVVADTQNVSEMQLNVTRSDLYDGSLGVGTIDEEAFRINVSNGTTSQPFYVFRDTGNTTIVVLAGEPDGFSDLADLLSAPESCSRTTSRAVIDFRAETFDGTACNALRFDSELDGTVEIRYENVRDSVGGAERVNGTYSLIVNGSSAIPTDGSDRPEHLNASGEPSPRGTAIVYAATYTTRYVDPEVTHSRTRRFQTRKETYAA